MEELAGTVFCLAKTDRPVPGCTISRPVWQTKDYSISHFSLAGGTTISPESYHYSNLWICLSGDLRPTALHGEGAFAALHPGDAFLTPIRTPVGSASKEGCVYTSIQLKEDTNMNNLLHAGEIFSLKDLIPYQEGRIVNMDLIDDAKLKLVLMSFDAGTGLPEHAAPGEALIFALDGEAVIGYEGKQYPIHAGENFKFDKGGAHSVTASQQFKMALLLTLE